MAVEVLKSQFANGVALPRHEGALPLALVIGGETHMVSRLTDDGAIVVDYDGEAEPGQYLSSTLMVGLEGFDLTVPAMWEVISSLRERRQLWLRLAPVNEASHQATITTVLEAIRSGEVLNAADMVAIAHAGEEQARATIDPPEPAHAAARRRFSAVLFGAIALVLLAFIGLNLAARLFYVHADGAIASPQAVTVQAPEESELIAVSAQPGTRVKPGDPLATLKTVTGAQLTVSATCDCIVGGQLANVPTLLRRGQPLARLVPTAGVNYAVLTMNLEDLRRVKVGDEVTVRYYDSADHIVGKITQVSPPRFIVGSDAQPARYAGTIEVRFDRNVPAARVGEAVTAKIKLSHLNPLA